MQRPRLLYVSGYIRSGSTVLDVVLGAHPDIVGVGELWDVFGLGWGAGEPCACGAPVPDCPFWAEVRRRLVARLGPGVEAEGRAGKRLERWRNLAPLEARGTLAGADRWGRIQAELLDAVRVTAGRAVVLDSTKQPTRGVLLDLAAGQSVSTVHLVRDPRAVGWSVAQCVASDWGRGVPRGIAPIPPERFVAEWIVTNLGSELALRRHGGLRLRHEDFVQDPQNAARRVLDTVGLPVAPLLPTIQGETPAVPGHQVAGNPMRRRGPMPLRLDESWRTDCPKRLQALFWAGTAPLALRYGYAPRSAKG
jgi:hypothetical protein